MIATCSGKTPPIVWSYWPIRHVAQSVEQWNPSPDVAEVAHFISWHGLADPAKLFRVIPFAWIGRQTISRYLGGILRTIVYQEK
jgi:hypothetical protein